MPYCIIFFTIALLYALIVMPKSISKWLSMILCIGLIIGYIWGDIEYNGFVVNIVSVPLTILAIIYLATLQNRKYSLPIVVSIMIVGLVYYVLLNNNYLVSVDYNINFAVLVTILPIFVLSNNFAAAILYSVLAAAAINIIDVVYWVNVIDIAQFNNANYLNLLAVLLSASIILCGLRHLLVKHHRYNNN